MDAFILVVLICFLLFGVTGVYASFFKPEQIDEEEAQNIEARHGRASRAYLRDFSARKRSPKYYARPEL